MSDESEVSGVTGLHFIYPGLLLFYVEGSEDNINDFVRLLNNLTAKEGLGLTKVKVVHIIHNIKVSWNRTKEVEEALIILCSLSESGTELLALEDH